MPTIKINPDLLISERPLDEERRITKGELVDVTDAEWETELRHHRTRFSGNVYRTYVTTDEDVPPDVEQLRFRPRDLALLTQLKLKEMAEERGLSKGGSKQDLADRIVAYEEAAYAATQEDSETA